MKLEKITHDHLLTKWLKVIIFSLLMLAPIFSIAVRCAYVVCNKNAYQSYSNKIEIVDEYETNDVETLNDLVVGRAYTYTYDENITSQCRLGIDKVLINQDLENYNFQIIGNTYDTTIRMNYTYNGVFYNTFTITTLNTTYNSYSTNNSIDFIYGNSNFNQNADIIISCISRCDNLPIQSINNENGTLDNVFDYSVNQLKNDQLFNWTQNTGIYTGVNAMTTGLGMTDGTIAILLTYWMLLTIIYVIIDIVLAGFTMLTHMIYNKKTE